MLLSSAKEVSMRLDNDNKGSWMGYTRNCTKKLNLGQRHEEDDVKRKNKLKEDHILFWESRSCKKKENSVHTGKWKEILCINYLDEIRI